MKIRIEDYPLLTKQKKVECLQEEGVYDANRLVDNFRESGNKALFFTNTVHEIISIEEEKYSQLLGETKNANHPEGTYCILLGSGISVFIEINRAFILMRTIKFHGNESRNWFNWHESDADVRKALLLLMFYLYADGCQIISDAIKQNNMATKNAQNEACDGLIKVISQTHIRNYTLTSEFVVREHVALRRCGKGRVDVREVLIKEYKKGGLNREAGIIKLNKKTEA